eukprot:CAMPEP_0118921936 /NCGR_PEP_ID=MMETSP1169-20130426/1054_1 /TAXON_ID=36882 /ORGANISM="Pyramimonas obovata, Strain CCMP722" /LENGTH=130 /DNA_ID=CAMNT_0006862743 /DNA_START=827 /DNA_END=1219 /DNA_ORIENTATION=+
MRLVTNATTNGGRDQVCGIELYYFVQWEPSIIAEEPDILNVQKVHKDPAWLDASLPVIRAFWDLVQEYRIDSQRGRAELNPPKRPRKSDDAAQTTTGRNHPTMFSDFVGSNTHNLLKGATEKSKATPVFF